MDTENLKSKLDIPQEWLDKLEPNQIAMLTALKLNSNNISVSCKSIKIARQTHYDWVNNNPIYSQAYHDITESVIDYVESSLLKNIKDGNVTAQIFFLKTKAKHRGYVERTEVLNKNVDVFDELSDTEIDEELEKLEKELANEK